MRSYQAIYQESDGESLKENINMAVIIRKTIEFGNQEIESKVIEPTGVLSKEDRLRAEKLDALLNVRIPEIAEEVIEEVKNDANTVKRWHTLGKKLREIVNDRELVLQSDIDNLLIWQAIWQYLPQTMLPERTNTDTPYPDKQHKRQDHLSLCYELSNFTWEEVRWIKKWSFVHEITARPSLLRDKRIFRLLGNYVSTLPNYPSVEDFREIMKNLVKRFPTKKFRDTTVFTDDDIYDHVSKAVDDSLSIDN